MKHKFQKRVFGMQSSSSDSSSSSEEDVPLAQIASEVATERALDAAEHESESESSEEGKIGLERRLTRRDVLDEYADEGEEDEEGADESEERDDRALPDVVAAEVDAYTQAELEDLLLAKPDDLETNKRAIAKLQAIQAKLDMPLDEFKRSLGAIKDYAYALLTRALNEQQKQKRAAEFKSVLEEGSDDDSDIDDGEVTDERLERMADVDPIIEARLSDDEDPEGSRRQRFRNRKSEAKKKKLSALEEIRRKRAAAGKR